MGTVTRFALGLAGLLSVAVGLALMGPGTYGTIVAPQEFDYPGGVPGIVAVIVAAASVPLLLGWYLLRKAFRSDAKAVLVTRVDSTSATSESLVPPAARLQPQSAFSAGTVPVVTPLKPRPSPRSSSRLPQGNPVGCGSRCWDCASRTSVGHATAIALVAVPLMLIWREVSPATGLVATMVFSLVDPVLNVWRRSWWLGAFASTATWVVLFFAIATHAFIAASISPLMYPIANNAPRLL